MNVEKDIQEFLTVEKDIQEFLTENPPSGYVPTAEDFQHFFEQMTAETRQYPDLAIVDGELVRGRLKGRRFVMAPEEVERMAEEKRERLRNQDGENRREFSPKGLL